MMQVESNPIGQYSFPSKQPIDSMSFQYHVNNLAKLLHANVPADSIAEFLHRARANKVDISRVCEQVASSNSVEDLSRLVIRKALYEASTRGPRSDSDSDVDVALAADVARYCIASSDVATATSLARQDTWSLPIGPHEALLRSLLELLLANQDAESCVRILSRHPRLPITPQLAAGMVSTCLSRGLLSEARALRRRFDQSGVTVPSSKLFEWAMTLCGSRDHRFESRDALFEAMAIVATWRQRRDGPSGKEGEATNQTKTGPGMGMVVAGEPTDQSQAATSEARSDRASSESRPEGSILKTKPAAARSESESEPEPVSEPRVRIQGLGPEAAGSESESGSESDPESERALNAALAGLMVRLGLHAAAVEPVLRLCASGSSPSPDVAVATVKHLLRDVTRGSRDRDRAPLQTLLRALGSAGSAVPRDVTAGVAMTLAGDESEEAFHHLHVFLDAAGHVTERLTDRAASRPQTARSRSGKGHVTDRAASDAGLTPPSTSRRPRPGTSETLSINLQMCQLFRQNRPGDALRFARDVTGATSDSDLLSPWTDREPHTPLRDDRDVAGAGVGAGVGVGARATPPRLDALLPHTLLHLAHHAAATIGTAGWAPSPDPGREDDQTQAVTVRDDSDESPTLVFREQVVAPDNVIGGLCESEHGLGHSEADTWSVHGVSTP